MAINNSFKFSDNVSYDNTDNGVSKGRVIDVIVRKGKTYVLIDPLYKSFDRRVSTILEMVEINKVRKVSNDEVEERASRRWGPHH